MTPASTSGKPASASIPYCRDQGIEYLLGATQIGQTLQKAVYTFAAGGVVSFAALRLQNMADGSYFVIATNTGAGGAAKIARDNTRTAGQFVITGPSVGDVVELIVIGAITGALTK